MGGLHRLVEGPLVGLLQCLCALLHIELTVPETLLASTRLLFRDTNNFISKLCKIRVSREEAQCLSTYLLSNSQFKKVRERSVNACCEALHSWISAVYFHAMAS